MIFTHFQINLTSISIKSPFNLMMFIITIQIVITIIIILF